ncbi:MAG: 30S ribosomal protein S3 [Epsilonproteobacteria bacterium]|nr:30S ribosomal protein S3 [Campylobacterota bacterium]
MGQKVNPIGFRVGVYRDWDAQWFPRSSTKGSYGKELQDDLAVRKYLDKALERAEVSRVEIKKTGGVVKVIVHSSRPGLIIGKKGQDVEKLKKELAKILQVGSVDVSVEEVQNPEVDAVLVAKNIASQLERRANFKKLMKRATASAMRAGARGIKICCKGRLNGAEIARAEWARVGSVPLHTLRADIGYGYARANTIYGIIGVKVWICVGEYQTK